MKRIMLFIGFMAICGLVYADSSALQTSDGNAVTSSNPLPVTFGTGAQTIAGSLTVTGGVTGNATTATALASAPTQCSAGQYPLGIAANGNAQNCTAAAVGGTTVTGDYTVTGNLTAGTLITTGVDERIYGGTYATNYVDFNDNAIYPSVNGLFTSGRIGIGTASPEASLGISNSGTTEIARFYGNYNGSTEINVTNTNSGASASSDIVATANNGTDTTQFIDMGINGSTGGVAPFTGVNEAYLYASDGTLDIGSGTGNPINFAIGGSTSVIIDANGNVGVGTTAPTAGYKMQVVGDIKMTNMMATGTVYASGGASVMTSSTIRGVNNSDYSFGTYGRNVITVDSALYGVGIRGDGTAFGSPNAALDVGAFTRTSLPAMASGSTDVGIKGSAEIDTNLYVDTGIYLTNTTNAALFIRQPDGGCSRCGVDAAGTTWSCINITCGAGM